jgi:hypothetical protein
MQGRVAPVTARTALGRRKDASVLVVADGLSGQPVLPRKVDRSQCAPPFEAFDTC